MLKTNWRESIDDIERGLKACIDSLDRYEQQFATVLADEPPPSSATTDPMHLIPPKSNGWAERLATAGERAASMERLLDEQMAVWQKFQSTVTDYRDSLKQSPLRTARDGD
jgi:hypothetical protein